MTKKEEVSKVHRLPRLKPRRKKKKEPMFDWGLGARRFADMLKKIFEKIGEQVEKTFFPNEEQLLKKEKLLEIENRVLAKEAKKKALKDKLKPQNHNQPYEFDIRPAFDNDEPRKKKSRKGISLDDVFGG